MSKEGSKEVEVFARNLLDVNFKYTWLVENYLKLLDQGAEIDSPVFEFKINGLKTKWTLSIRFWFDETGTRLSNPVVVCLNLVSAVCENAENVEIRYQFGLWNSEVKQYEVCPINTQEVSISGSGLQNLISMDYREVFILDRHLTYYSSIELFCKIMLVRSKFEENTLSLDLWNKLQNNELCDVILLTSDARSFPAHKTILSCRSSTFGELIRKGSGSGTVSLSVPSSILTSVLQYIYTDRVYPLHSPIPLLKASINYNLPGLKTICEKSLIDSITPVNVAKLLMVAQSFSCENLKRAGLAYIGENSGALQKTIAWKVMEDVHPELYEEVSQSQG